MFEKDAVCSVFAEPQNSFIRINVHNQSIDIYVTFVYVAHCGTKTKFAIVTNIYPVEWFLHLFPCCCSVGRLVWAKL